MSRNARSANGLVREGLQLLDVSVGFGEPLFTGVTRRVDLGSSLALMGPSGSGKTTLLNAIAGLVPSAGEIRIAGEVVTLFAPAARDRHRLRHVGQVFQDAELLPELNALENAGLPGRLLGESAEIFEARARGDLEMLGLGDRLNAWPGELSGGQRQRVALARALNNDPTVILADEPTGALDATNAELVAHHLTQLARDREVCVVIATHDHAVAAHCDEVWQLRPSPLERSGAID